MNIYSSGFKINIRIRFDVRMLKNKKNTECDYLELINKIENLENNRSEHVYKHTHGKNNLSV